MKKIVPLSLILIALLIGFFYFFIPNIITLKSSITIPVTQKGLYRLLTDKSSNAKWWPGTCNKDLLYLNNYSYKIVNNNLSLLPVFIQKDSLQILTSLYIISLTTDSIRLEWVGGAATSYNPLKRFLAYQKCKQLNTDMDIILKRMQLYFSDPKNIYGCDIKKELVVDANLITTYAKCKGYPTTIFIYSQINKLKRYAELQKTSITGYPMVNIEQTDSINYFVKVALPLEKVLPGNADILQKQMLKNGNILVTEIKGGYVKTGNIFEQMINYANDYDRKMPAIPFYSLITDRTKETDSTKWVTKIYCPVM